MKLTGCHSVVLLGPMFYFPEDPGCNLSYGTGCLTFEAFLVFLYLVQGNAGITGFCVH